METLLVLWAVIQRLVERSTVWSMLVFVIALFAAYCVGWAVALRLTR